MHDDRNNYLHLLSDSMQQMVGVIGFDNTLLIMGRYGGQMLTIATGKKNSAAKSKLTKLIGDPQAKKIMREFSGEFIYIPTVSAFNRRISRHERNNKIRARLEELTTCESSQRRAIELLSNEFNITDRLIYKIINGR